MVYNGELSKMIVQKDFLNKLKDFGLNTYESKLWTALLSRGISTAGELSDIANVPRSRSYDVLESLEKKGFIVMKLGKPIKYIAVPPVEVLERVKKKIKDESEGQVKAINDLKQGDVMSELNLLHSQGIDLVDPTDLSGSVRGRNNLYDHIETMIKSAEKSVTILTSPQSFSRDVEALRGALTKAKQKGVKIKFATQVTKEISASVKEISKIAEIKHTAIKGRFCLVDSRELIFMLMDDKDVHPSYDVGVWVTTPLFASSLDTMFENEWKSMKDADIVLK